jgi:hypothetical protein
MKILPCSFNLLLLAIISHGCCRLGLFSLRQMQSLKTKRVDTHSMDASVR